MHAGRRDPDLYDALLTTRARQWDISWYRSQLEAHTGRVLELGSGTGRVLAALVADGLDAYGLEYDREMLRSCRDRLAQAFGSRAAERVIEGDMRDFSLPFSVGAYIAPYNVLAALGGEPDLRRLLACMDAHRSLECRFLFDIVVADALPWSRPPYTWINAVELPANRVNAISAHEIGVFNPDTRVLRIEQTFAFQSGERSTEVLHLYQWRPHDLLALLSGEGWVVEGQPTNSAGETFTDGHSTMRALLTSRPHQKPVATAS